MSKREQELEAILRELVPATREILWCALVWNDHNFNEKDLRDKADRAAKSLGFWPRELGDQIGRVNVWLERADTALRPAEQHSREHQP